jgi:eukaryotic-like serine/threonine-protein kinase
MVRAYTAAQRSLNRRSTPMCNESNGSRPLVTCAQARRACCGGYNLLYFGTRVNLPEGNTSTERRVRFGIFEADLNAGQLRKNGRVVRLQEQPFRVLAALLDRPGDIVTRDELRERLWPTDSFGDFDQGLNTAINKLRDALGDSATAPRFVETLPRRGYRFVYKIELPAAAPGADPTAPEPEPERNPKYRRWVVLLAITAACVSVAIWFARGSHRTLPPVRHFTIRAVAPIALMADIRSLAISPNGRHIAAVEADKRSVLIRDLDREQPRNLEGTEGALTVFWSPDSTMIGFAVGGTLNKVPVRGGPVIRICEIRSYISGAAWSPDGLSVVFTAGSPSALYIVASTGGTPKLLVSPQIPDDAVQRAPFGWISNPYFLPAGDGGQTVLLAYLGGGTGSGDNAVLMMRDLKSGRQAVLGPGNNPSYSPTGHLLFRLGSDLWARPFSLDRRQFTGDAVRIARNATDPSVAADGTLVYRDAVMSQLTWIDRRGQRVGTVGPPADALHYPAVSPDGRLVAVETAENNHVDVWIYDVERGARVRLTSHPATEILPVWSPDGKEVAYGSYRAGNTDIFIRRADAVADEMPVATAPQNERVSDWSRDGQRILYSVLAAKTGDDLWFLRRNAAGKWEPHAFLQSAATERCPKLSPNGRFVAYLSDESGRDELYVREFQPAGRKWPVSTTGASQVRWSANGRELYYVEAGTLMAVSVATEKAFVLGSITRLFSHEAFAHSYDANYDVSRDGTRFLVSDRLRSQGHQIHVIQNWFGML